MKTFNATILCLFLCVFNSYSQSVQDIINQVDIDVLSLILQEYSGEVSTIVDGNTVTITNRQQANNDLAADYLVEKLEQLNNITITDQSFNTNGRNIIATQIGKTNPNDIYIICAHYDTVADYCADDNATGTAAVLEAARILSTQCLDNTIVYALWDEEEIGLNGSAFYATQAAANGDNILGVLNLDMIGYDSDAPGTAGDNEFDIDVNNFANSIDVKDDIVSVLNSYTFDLSVIVVNPGTFSSDHSSFWMNGYSAVLLGESWETNDETPFYHSSGDRFNTIDLPYFLELTKLTTAYMATVGGLVDVDNSITNAGSTLTSDQSSATYQWINCDTNSPISGATSQSYTPTVDGIYAVEITSGTCTEVSDCIVFDTLGLDDFLTSEVKIFPNPVKTTLNVEIVDNNATIALDLFDVSGKLVLQKTHTNDAISLHMKNLPQGVYFLKVSSSEKTGTYKIVKE
ncbi:M28 family peptidase [Psychroserpens ponticola]|uniref:M28 family peptidase n=1 Tax=Psychroserpens ponticola TaxID=2932268 RepID=A0ABY7RW42_9FLAO|nr:M28 family peptidase [Psychroserpens ponticola]WCO01329.1 M28 family peptidase [Psychroserpens ponticola]